VVPTWNYIAVHAYGPVEFFQKPERLLEVVTRLTNIHEKSRAKLWAVVDPPADFIASQLRGIVGVRIPVTRFEGKRKMRQNRPVADRSRGRATGETLDRPIRRAPCRRPGCALQASHLRSCPVRPIPLLAPPGLEPAGGLPPPPARTFHWPAGRGVSGALSVAAASSAIACGEDPSPSCRAGWGQRKVGRDVGTGPTTGAARLVAPVIENDGNF
jgi:Putative FMN-binding domain